MVDRYEQWQMLRSKADETADDPDWVATNDGEAGSIDYVDIDGFMPPGQGYGGRPYTGIEIVLLGVDAARAVQDRGSMTMDVQLIEFFDRDREMLGGAPGLEGSFVETEVEEDVPLHAKVYFPFNGGNFTIRLTGDTNDNVDNVEVWWRAVSR